MFFFDLAKVFRSYRLPLFAGQFANRHVSPCPERDMHADLIGDGGRYVLVACILHRLFLARKARPAG